MNTIKVITGSIRPNRFNIQPATWIYRLLSQNPEVKAQLLDLQKIQLPFLDEEKPPKAQQYHHQYTKDWSKEIREADGFVWVTPEYNHSISPVLKNAIDYLYFEWNYKPVAFVSYGSLAGGSRAVEHLRLVAAELKMYDVRDQIMLPNYWHHQDDNGQYQFTEQLQQQAVDMLKELSFWSSQFKQARHKLERGGQ